MSFTFGVLDSTIWILVLDVYSTKKREATQTGDLPTFTHTSSRLPCWAGHTHSSSRLGNKPSPSLFLPGKAISIFLSPLGSSLSSLGCDRLLNLQTLSPPFRRRPSLWLFFLLVFLLSHHPFGPRSPLFAQALIPLLLPVPLTCPSHSSLASEDSYFALGGDGPLTLALFPQ